MDAKHKAVIDKIIRLSSRNEEFNKALREQLFTSQDIASAPLDAYRLEHIYEYCIERIVRQQAIAFYHEFPIAQIVPQLVEDYVRMEYFRRKDAFADFSLALYQQVECITNHLCRLPELAEVVERLWGHSTYLNTKQKEIKDKIKRMGNFTIWKGNSELKTEQKIATLRELRALQGVPDYQIAHHIFPGYDMQGRKEHALLKPNKPLADQSAVDKMRIVVYFLGYGTMMLPSDYHPYVNETNTLRDLYQCRNMNHRGDQPFDWQQEILDRIIPQKAIYYFKFLGALAQYVEYAKRGVAFLPILSAYATAETPIPVHRKR